MDKKTKTSYTIIMSLGVLGTLASIYNFLFSEEIDWYMGLISFICSLSLIYGALQLKNNSSAKPED